jgi:hypothetical protein
MPTTSPIVPSTIDDFPYLEAAIAALTERLRNVRIIGGILTSHAGMLWRPSSLPLAFEPGGLR